MAGRCRDRVFIIGLVAFIVYLVVVVAAVWHGSAVFRDVNAGLPSERWRHNGDYRDFIDSVSPALAVFLCCAVGAVALDEDFWWVGPLLYMLGFCVTHVALSRLPEVYFPGGSYGGEFFFVGYSIPIGLLWLVFVAAVQSGKGSRTGRDWRPRARPGSQDRWSNG